MSSDAPLPNSGLPPAQPPWPHQTRQIHHDLPQRCPAAAAAASGLQPQQNQPPSPFLRLPSEIRLLVYSYLLPHASTITFHPLTRKHPSTGTPTPAHAVHIPGVWASIGIWTGLLRTCRQLHAEGIDALYGRNLFHFSLTSKERVWAFTPAAPASPAADQGSTARRRGGGGGPVAANGASGGGVNALNTPHARGLPVNTLRTSGIGPAALRRMRAVVLRIEEDLSRPESYRRVQAWLREWVERLNAAGGHCLQELRVELVTGVFRYGGFPSFTDSVFWEFLPERSHDAGAQWQFVLEPLAELGGLREVEVRGHVKPEFAKRLAGKMMAAATPDDGCRMDGIEYAERKVERKTGPVARSTRKFYEPELDWQLQGD